MKKTLLAAVIISSFLASCSDEDNGSTSKTAHLYFPEADGNYWTYDVAMTEATNRDSLYVLKDTVINSKTYKKLNTKTTPFGFLSSSLNKNGVRAEGNKIYLSGGLGLDFTSALPIEFKLEDFVMFKEDAKANEQLSTASGTVEQAFQGFPLKIDYTLKSVAQPNIASFTAKNGEVYHDIKPVLFTLELKISTTFSGTPINILNTQNVVTSTQYYVKNVGVVYTKTEMTYQTPDFAQMGIELPIPQSGSQSQEEFLDKYMVAN